MLRIGHSTIALVGGAAGLAAFALVGGRVPGPGWLNALASCAVFLIVALPAIWAAIYVLGARGWLVDWRAARFGGWRGAVAVMIIIGWCGVVAVVNAMVPISTGAPELFFMIGAFVGLLIITSVVETWVARGGGTSA